MNALSSVGYFLVTTLFGLVTFVLWIRLFIRYFSISPFNPFVQSIYQLTNPVIIPIQRYVTQGKMVKSRYDLACFVLLVACELLKFIILNALILKNALPFMFLGIYVIVDLVVEPCNLLFYAIIARTLMSWFALPGQHPVLAMLYAVTEPMLRFFRRSLPSFGAFDLSPLFAIILLEVIELLVRNLFPFPLF